MTTIRAFRCVLVLTVASLGLTAAAEAQTNDEVFPQVQWNFSTPGARANGMGRTFIGTADDASAAVTNPAGLMSLTRPQVYAEYKNTDISVDRLATVDAGVTTVDYAIALSGTLLLACDVHRPRSTSLLPPLHIAVLSADRIVPTLDHFFQHVTRPLPSALTFITGPSRTADIELTPVKGVHGPVEVIIYLLR